MAAKEAKRHSGGGVFRLPPPPENPHPAATNQGDCGPPIGCTPWDRQYPEVLFSSMRKFFVSEQKAFRHFHPGEKSKKGAAALFFVAERGIFKGEMSRNISPLNGVLVTFPPREKLLAAAAAKYLYSHRQSRSPQWAKPPMPPQRRTLPKRKNTRKEANHEL